jgi:hypothetical protein
MDYPVQATLASFAKICADKSEIPFFDGREIKKFFYEAEKDYPKIFENTTENSMEDELFNFKVSRIIQSIAPDFHPHLISKAGIIVYERNKNKYPRKIQEIAQKFYDKLGCNLEGKVGEHTRIMN